MGAYGRYIYKGLKTPAYWVALEETTNQMSNQPDPTHIVFLDKPISNCGGKCHPPLRAG